MKICDRCRRDETQTTLNPSMVGVCIVEQEHGEHVIKIKVPAERMIDLCLDCADVIDARADQVLMDYGVSIRTPSESYSLPPSRLSRFIETIPAVVIVCLIQAGLNVLWPVLRLLIKSRIG